MNYHALNAMLYIQVCSKLSVSQCLENEDFCIFMINLITFYPAEWEFYCRAINMEKPND